MNYRDHFNHIGERLDDWTLADEIICAIAIVVISVFISGALI